MARPCRWFASVTTELVDLDRFPQRAVIVLPDGSPAILVFDPNQPRNPPGTKGGGRWRKVPGASLGSEVTEMIGGEDVSPDEFWSLYDKIEDELQDPRNDLKEIRTTAGHTITIDPEHPPKMEMSYSGEEKISRGRLIVEFPDLESWRRGNPGVILDRAKEMGDVEIRKDGTVRDRTWDSKDAADMVAQMTPGKAVRVPVERVTVEHDLRPGGEHVAVSSPFSPGTVYNGEWLKPEPHPLINRALVGPDKTYDFQEQHLNPDTPLYHVSVNLPAVKRDGYLTIGHKGGLGSFGEEESVSFTLDGDAVDVMVGDMKRHIRLAKASPDIPENTMPVDPPQDWIDREGDDWLPPRIGKGKLGYELAWRNYVKAEHERWSHDFLDLLAKEAEKDGWKFNTDGFQSSQTESYNYRDWLNEFYSQRPEPFGGNPIYLSLDWADQRKRDEKNIGAVQTTLGQAQSYGALLTYLYSEDEVRVYADIPMTDAKVIRG